MLDAKKYFSFLLLQMSIWDNSISVMLTSPTRSRFQSLHLNFSLVSLTNMTNFSRNSFFSNLVLLLSSTSSLDVADWTYLKTNWPHGLQT